MSTTRPFASFVGKEAVVLDQPAGAYNPETQIWEDEKGMPTWQYGGPSTSYTGYKGITDYYITSPCGWDYTYDYDDTQSD